MPHILQFSIPIGTLVELHILQFSIPSEHSRIWVCSKCDRVWAILQGAQGTSKHFLFSDCSECGVGSLLDDFWEPKWERLVDSFPPHILRLEFNRLLRSFHECNTASDPTDNPISLPDPRI